MLIRKKNIIEKSKLNVTISKEVEQDLINYMEYIQETDKNYIVEEALRLVFRKDKDFDKWKKDSKNNKEDLKSREELIEA